MSKKHYNWGDGPAIIDEHSITKHQVLVDYLIRYFDQRTRNSRGQESFKLTLVDGFCGGGEYYLRGTKTLVLGSPFRIIEAVESAKKLVNLDRKKPIIFDVQFVFIDKNVHAIRYLRKALTERGFGAALDNTIHLVHAEFAETADAVLAKVRSHTPRVHKALFFLDQYGYTEVPAPLIRKIFEQANNAEIVLTFHVSSFATYTNDELAEKVSKTLQIDIFNRLDGRTIEDIKQSDADWRRFIQAALYDALVVGCGASFFTPFFIRGKGAGHGEYWLVHLSQHHRAQDVMKGVHWKLSNHFVHYGGPGLNMLAPHTMGFLQEFDGGFRFDDVARGKSDEALTLQLAQFIFAHGAMTFAALFSKTCNGSPASAEMYKEVLEKLINSRDIEIQSLDGKPRYLARYIVDTDLVQPARQMKLFLPC
ncbi:three-Cys-motif partner protein TcmP [Caballeronia sp. NK8]|uniref:three-Cys-motif partner protein TcmP n=1 Tax=Caballeronia sp. NK8 TaxID=140098 RepID=UPI001BB70B19|nr:three-Cys-motif partner protein TcmP [Caballeronia sp. NK8]BCQ21904.1 three-Cys-motif partner protein TcmP [Caballeronia sp. NK8]